MTDFLPIDFEPIDENSVIVHRRRTEVKKKLAVLTVTTIIAVTSGVTVLFGSKTPTTPQQMDQQQLLLWVNGGSPVQPTCIQECQYCFAYRKFLHHEFTCGTECTLCKQGCTLKGISASDSNNNAAYCGQSVESKGCAAGWNSVNVGGTYLNMCPCGPGTG